MAESLISRQQVFSGRAVSLRVDTVRLASGRVTTREIVEHRPSVVMVPLDGEGTIYLIRQLRHAVDREILELPAGTTEPGETPEECVRRELQEEIGYAPGRVEEIGGFYTAPGYSTEYLHLFLATELVPSPAVAEDTEYIKPVRLPLEEVIRLIAAGQIQDAKTIAGLHLLLVRKGELFHHNR